MKIVFNGLIEKKTKGCNCKGGRKTEYGYTTSKVFILPSGRSVRFLKGVETEVEGRDGSFLLSYNGYDLNGVYRELFTEVR